jgi:hypothetical protein
MKIVKHHMAHPFDDPLLVDLVCYHHMFVVGACFLII